MAGGIGVKICGVCSPRDAADAVAAGATHVGVIRVPGSRRTRSLAVARDVCAAVRDARRVGVFVDAPDSVILSEAGELELDVVQLHGAESADQVERLKRRGLEVWKVIKPAAADDLVAGAERYADADLILLEGSSDRGSGGVGASFPWAAVAAGLERLAPDTRLGVGGGLNPDNVGEAVRHLAPVLVDVSSGVERAVCQKDPARVRAFVAAAVEAAGTVARSHGS